LRSFSTFCVFIRRSRTGRSISKRFSEFNWLVVDDKVPHDDMGPEGRRLPDLFMDLGQDFERIEPYKTGLPPAVEAALFGLLTIPWERMAA
jgi:hypothetical protein